jgi:signal transduction histidine kinase
MDWLVAGSYALIYLVVTAMIAARSTAWSDGAEDPERALVPPLGLTAPGLAVGGFAALGLLGAAALLVWRRKHPVWLAVAAMTLDLVEAWLIGGSGGPLLFWALFAVAGYAGARALWICGAASLVELLVAGWMFGGWSGAALAGRAVGTFGAMAVYVSILAQMGGRRRYVAALVDSAKHLALERDQRAKVAVAQERERISRELHDVVAHSVAVMVTLSDGAAAAVEKNPARARLAMERVSETGREAVSDMRRLLAMLHLEPDLAPQPGVADLVPLVESFKASGLPVTVELSAAMPQDRALGLAVYRIIQESLTNVLRHAPGVAWVKAAVAQEAEGVVAVTVENGPPAPGEQPEPWDGSGRGIVGMRERVEGFGGTLEAGATPEGGWLVKARLGR